MFEDDFAPPVPPRPLPPPIDPFPSQPPLAHPQLQSAPSSSSLQHSRPRVRYSTNPSPSGTGANGKARPPVPGEWMRSRSRSVSAEPGGGVPPPIPERPVLNGNVKDNLADTAGGDVHDVPDFTITDDGSGPAGGPIPTGLDADGDVPMASPSIDGASHLANSIGRPPSSHFSTLHDLSAEGESSGSNSNSGYGSLLNPNTSSTIPIYTGGTSFFSPNSPALSATSFPLPPQSAPPDPPVQPAPPPKAPRPLPPRPHPPSPTLVPTWEPDIKSHIPPSLTLDSRLAAYSTQAAPPPRLRSQVKEREEKKRVGKDGYGRLRGKAEREELVLDRRVGSASSNGAGSSSAHAQSAKDDANKGIAGEWWFDPVIVTRELMAQGKDAWGGRATFGRTTTSGPGRSGGHMANGGLNRLGPNPAVKCARLAVLDGRINVRLCILDEGSSDLASPDKTGPALSPSSPSNRIPGARPEFIDGVEQTRTKAGVEVNSRKGDVRVEVPQMDDGRQMALSVKSKSGNILVLLPDTYRGTIHCSTASNRTTTLLPALRKSFRVVKDWRGETVGYLGKPSMSSKIAPPSAIPELPTRRSSARLRGMAAEASAGGNTMSTRGAGPYPRDGSWRSLKARDQERLNGMNDFGVSEPEGAVSSSPPPMDLSMVMNDDRTGQATVADDETIKEIDENEDGPESLVTLSSYTGEVAIGLDGHEGEEEFLTYVPGFGNGKGIAGAGPAGANMPGLGRARSMSYGLSEKTGGGVADVVAKGKGKGKEVMKKGMRFLGV